MSALSFDQLEVLYDDLAQAIDHVGVERESVFLTKLVLCMAHEFGHAERIATLVKQCAQEPEPPTVDGRRLL